MSEVHPLSPQVEAVARLLCGWAEYHEGNWPLYVAKAREVIAAYLKAAQE